MNQDEAAEQNEPNDHAEANERTVPTEQREHAGKDEPVEPLARRQPAANESYNFVEANKRRVSSNFYSSMQNTLTHGAVKE